MADRYTVEAWVPPGVPVAEIERPTFDEILAEADRLAERYPHASFSFGNIDRADIGYNGLTEYEEDRLNNAGEPGHCSCGRPVVETAPASMSSPAEYACPVCDCGVRAEVYDREAERGY
jgi:hypothetical protein